MRLAQVEYDRDHPHERDRTTVVGRVALTGETVQIPDILDDPEYAYGAQEITPTGHCSGFRSSWTAS